MTVSCGEAWQGAREMLEIIEFVKASEPAHIKVVIFFAE